jgi:hypothetical protein
MFSGQDDESRARHAQLLMGPAATELNLESVRARAHVLAATHSHLCIASHVGTW